MEQRQEIFKAYERFMDTYAQGSSRYKSFDFIYDKFATYYEKYFGKEITNDTPTEAECDELAHYLFTYLASWGMLRDSFLMYKNYQVLKPVIKALFKEDYRPLYHIDPQENKITKQKYWELMKEIGTDLETALKQEKKYYKLNEELQIPTPSLTLLSKILMGTLGCVPAVDRFDKYTLGLLTERKTYKYNQNSLQTIWDVAVEYGAELKTAQVQIEQNYKRKYSIFKVLDMCLWQYGSENNPSVKKK